METLRGIRYKLRMMRVELSGPLYIYDDNMSVIHTTQQPESILKKSISVCYHALREAHSKCLTGHVLTNNNLADICTKLIPGGPKRNHLVGLVLHDIVDHNLYPLTEVQRLFWVPLLSFDGQLNNHCVSGVPITLLTRPKILILLEY
jgi:hypothetical protein